MEWLSDPQAWIALLTLTVLEIVLGIDNIIFISILSGKLPPEQQGKARKLGLTGAFVSRILLLLSISWIARLTTPLFTIGTLQFIELEAREITGRDLILIFGGLFLIAKATYEIHHKLEGEEVEKESTGKKAVRGLTAVVAQIMVVDIVFSLDSVITAVGMVDDVRIMIAANVVALAFLILIAVMLIAEGFGQHIDKGYIYFAMAFSVVMEMLNVRLRGSSKARTDATAETPEGM